jgi:hypothetical protein
MVDPEKRELANREGNTDRSLVQESAGKYATVKEMQEVEMCVACVRKSREPLTPCLRQIHAASRRRSGYMPDGLDRRMFAPRA